MDIKAAQKIAELHENRKCECLLGNGDPDIICYEAKSFIEGWNACAEKAAETCADWRTFYCLMQERSGVDEKDGLYRAFAADDIRDSIKKLQTSKAVEK